MMSTQALVQDLKKNSQDWEWYPTSERMIDTIVKNLADDFSYTPFSLLDIGAGDGRVLTWIDKKVEEVSAVNQNRCSVTDKYAIEKSPILIQQMPEDICIVGTDFVEQTIIDKSVDVIFCNPPYSDFESWMYRIITESNCKYAYFIVPDRWACNSRIQEGLKKREATVSILGTDDFEDGNRKARAVVNILCVSFVNKKQYGYSDKLTDPFDIWFEENFKIEVSTHSKTDSEIKKDTQDRIKSACKNQKENAENSTASDNNTLVKGKSQIEVLVELYQNDMQILISNYQSVCKLNPDILRELGVSVVSMKSGLRMKIQGLKQVYWEELFNRLESLTNRLTTKTRKQMLDRLQTHSNVDFTEQNIYAIVVWALKNSNKYIDQQLLDLYDRVTCQENVINYKSNQHMTADTWRYCRWNGRDKDKIHHYKLEYRLVLSCYAAISGGGRGYSFDFENGLYKDCHSYIGDIFTIAKNLGYNVIETTHDFKWCSGRSFTFHYRNPKDEEKPLVFAEIRAYMNGNFHIKFCQDFIKSFNIEAGRLNGWIKSPREASDEMGIDIKTTEKFFGVNFQIGAGHATALLLGTGDK